MTQPASGKDTGKDKLGEAGADGLRAVPPEGQQMARPTGFEFPDTIPAGKRIPVGGADRWWALAERPA